MTHKEIEELFTYHAPNTESIVALQEVRIAAKLFCQVLEENVPDCADKSAAVRKLRECVMTANAGIVLNQKGI